MKSSGEMADGDGSDKSSPEALQQQQQQLKRGHRKKTLSLNPEEREALENLVEEVIIGGLGEAIIDSDSSSSSSDDELDSPKQPDAVSGSQSDTTHRIDSVRNKESYFEETSRSSKGNVKDSGSGSERNFSPKTAGRNVSRNVNGKDYNRRSRENVNNRGPKEVKKGIDFRQNKTASPEEDKEKPNAATVRGVNIYPAQLKVAIKHMDSLPPRFLRRLQTGSSRTVGNESILACLTMKSPSLVQPVADCAKVDDAVVSPTDRDRGKSKQTQLQETKKTIRNLLCDLDQYTDETVITKEDCVSAGQQAAVAEKVGTTELVLPSMPNGFSGASPQQMRPQQQLYFGQPYGLKASHFTSPSQLQPGRPPSIQPFSQTPMQFVSPQSQSAPRMLSCEELEREMLHGPTQSLGSPLAGLEPGGAQANGSVSNQFYPQSQPAVSLGQSSQVTPKKIQFSVDAPEFVSSYYSSNRAKGDQAMAPSEPFYTMPPPPPHSSEMTVQILRDNVHMPSKPILFPQSVMPPPNVPTPNASTSHEYIDMPLGSSVTQQSYHVVPYEQMGSTHGLGMMRNTPSYMAPVSLQMPPPMTGTSDVVSPSVVNVNAMHYQTYPYVSAGNGFNTAYAQTAEFNQVAPSSYMTMPMCSTDVSSPNWVGGDMAGQPQSSQLGWYPGYTSMTYTNSIMGTSQQSGFDDVMYGGNPQSYADQQQMMTGGGSESWQYVGMPLTALEVGRQKVLQLLSEGASVMVILIGGPEGDKLSLISDLPVNGNGALVLNMRNGMCNGNASKMFQLHEWNLKQVMEALEVRKSPIIIDSSCAQPWERQQYTKLAEMHGYHVEIIDTTGTSQQGITDIARQNVVSGEIYQTSPLVSSDIYHGGQPTTDIYHGQQIAEDVVNSVVGPTNT
jgi:hypothetical protein